MFRPLYKEFKTGKYVIRDNLKYKLCGYQYGFFNNESTWLIPHNSNSFHFLLDVIVNNEIIKDYDLKIIDANNILLDFHIPLNGIVNLLIYAGYERDDCVPPFVVTMTPTPTITPTKIPPSPTPTPTPTPTPNVEELFLLGGEFDSNGSNLIMVGEDGIKDITFDSSGSDIIKLDVQENGKIIILTNN